VSYSQINPMKITGDPTFPLSQHRLTFNGCAPDFFAGAILGNGGLGCIVTTRPDSVLLYFGHNAVWDIRIEEFGGRELGTFQEIFDRVRAIPKGGRIADDPRLREYFEKAGAPYAKPYPRPFPCGSLLLGFDRRDTAVIGHDLDLATGICRVEIFHGGQRIFLEVFLDQTADRLWMRGCDAAGEAVAVPFVRVRVLPDPRASKGLPPWKEWVDETAGVIGFQQALPFVPADAAGQWSASPEDRFFSTVFRAAAGIGAKCPDVTTSIWNESGNSVPENDALHRDYKTDAPFLACLEVRHGALREAPPLESLKPSDLSAIAEAGRNSLADWAAFWARSAVELDDELLERTWYRNLYFFHCAVRSGQTCPGLFANWSAGNIGTAWHGDWHLNYNIQQPFWLPFAANQLDHHLPYVDMVDAITPVAEWTASAYFGLRGAYYPHSAYPVKMTAPPYLVPTWGWEICETPWAVQSLWWHFLYSQDLCFLRERAFPRMRASARFLADYLLRPDASGPQPEGLWNDDKLHLFPSVVPELHGLEPGFERNFDITIDITLTRFLLRAVAEAIRLLGLEQEERELASDIAAILPRLPNFPTAQSQRGEVFVNVNGEDPEIVQNAPASTSMIFPGEEIGPDSSPELYEIACRSLRSQNNEGGNDLVHLAMQGARLGILDLEAFKRQIRYCLLPNGTCANMVMESRGRYHDTTDRDWMAKAGIWFENFSLPAVINECLMQSVGGVVRLFPNWPMEKRAAFRDLRAVGAFLVSASCERGKPGPVSVLSEAGHELTFVNPWPGRVRIVRQGAADEIVDAQRLHLPTTQGETLCFLEET
jgi:alpha-L-fucosidase 2